MHEPTTNSLGDRNRGGPSPFVAISPRWRAVIIGYFVLFNLLVPAGSYLIHGPQYPLPMWRFTALVLHQFLIVVPFVFYQNDFGWVHPVVFPPLYNLAKKLVKYPEHLLDPLLVLTQPVEPEIFHDALGGWSLQDLAWVNVETKLVLSLALAVYYAGFYFGPKLPIPELSFPQKLTNFRVKILGILLFIAVVFVGYMVYSGGLVQHMQSLAKGRHRALAQEGHILRLINSSFLVCAIWYSLDGRATRRIVFWACTVGSMAVIFVTTGNRGGIVNSMLLLLLLWMLRHRRVPALRAVAVGMVGVVLVGVLGTFRAQLQTDQPLPTETLTEANPLDAVSSARDEFEERSKSQGPKPIIAKVPKQVDLLWGETYLGVAGFFIPSAIWEEKPRGVGAYYAQTFLHASEEGLGVPVGGVAEAYWNFYLPGVILVFLLYGMFHSWVARVFLRYARQPALWVPLVVTLRHLRPTSPLMTPYLQKMVIIGFLLWFVGALALKSNRPN